MTTRARLLTKGRSQSLRRTIREMREILAGNGVRPTGELRRTLFRLLRDYGEHWYRLGFTRGIDEVRRRNPKAVRKVLPIHTSRKLWLLGRRSRIHRSVRIRHT